MVDRIEPQCGDIADPLPEPTAAELRTALGALGVHPCDHPEHLPTEPGAEVAGLLACLLAAVQRHIQDRPEHAETIAVAYHAMRHNFGFPCEAHCG